MDKTAIGYIRISDKDEKSVSLDYQQAEIEKYCNREGFELVAVECDEGISGKSIEARPGVQRILQAVDNQAIDAIVVYKSDRLSRDGIESLQIENLFLKRGVDYLSVTEGCLTSDSVDDEFMRYIRAGLNQRERKLISLRTRTALKRKKEKGEKYCRCDPYGWRSVDGKLVRDVTEQAIIRRMKQLHRAGLSLRKIDALLRDEGHSPRNAQQFPLALIARMVQQKAA